MLQLDKYVAKSEKEKKTFLCHSSPYSTVDACIYLKCEYKKTEVVEEQI